MKRELGSKTFLCELAGQHVELEWRTGVFRDDSEPEYQKLGKCSCTGVGLRNCPVREEEDESDFSGCPHLPSC